MDNKNYINLSDKRTRELVFNKYNGKCAYCGEKLKQPFCIDHIIPLRRGTNDYDRENLHKLNNLNPACQSCNTSKSDFKLEVWRNELELKIMRIERDNSTFRLLKRFGMIGIKKTKVVFYFETLNY